MRNINYRLSQEEHDAFTGLEASYANKKVHWQGLCLINRKIRPKRYFSAQLYKNVTCKRCLKMLGLNGVNRAKELECNI